jgi:hypothetical protein
MKIWSELLNLANTRQWLVARFCDNGDELSFSIKAEESLDNLSYYQLLKQDFVSWS